MFIEAKNEQEWKDLRLKYITASDAGNYCGVNPYDPNGKVHLWEEKVGLHERPDIGDKPAVKFGKNAEDLLRQLFLLKHPELHLVRYNQFGLWVSDNHPFMAATLDGEVGDDFGNEFNLEIKTGTVRDYKALSDWRNRVIPINYHCQVCHQLECKPKTKGTFVFSYIRAEWNPSESFVFDHYFDRVELADDIKHVINEAVKFNSFIQNKKKPRTVISL